MNIVVISDTHGKHRLLDIPEGDAIVHCGDITWKSNIQEVLDFIDWYASLNFRYKILIGGNHDRYLAKNTESFRILAGQKGIIYLKNQSFFMEGVHVFGSPNTINYGGFGVFTYEDEETARNIWNAIPPETDILITHGPPKGFGDFSMNDGIHAGCPVLLEKVLNIRPACHLFGHIHEAYGIEKNEDTIFVNAALTNGAEEIINKPVKINVKF